MVKRPTVQEITKEHLCNNIRVTIVSLNSMLKQVAQDHSVESTVTVTPTKTPVGPHAIPTSHLEISLKLVI